MVAYIWPIAVLVLSNTLYQISAKSMPGEVNPFAALIVTYGVGIVAAIGVYYLTCSGQPLLEQFKLMNWTPFVLGFGVLGIEAGYIYAYRAGRLVSNVAIVQSSILAIILLVVGYFLFHETISLNKLIGVVICMIGLIVMNYK